MSLSTSILAFDDALQFLERALADTKGVRACFGESEGNAMHFRMRCHAARNIARQDNIRLYTDRDHPLHGRSVYDVLTLRVLQDDDEGEWWVYATRNVMPAVVESLSEIEGEYDVVEKLEHQPATKIEQIKPKQLEYLRIDRRV